MNKKIRDTLVSIAQEKQTKGDPSHGFDHINRVLNLAVKIGKKEKADLDIVIPAALFHDIIVHRKDSPESKNETEESAEMAGHILREIKKFPQEKIPLIQKCIRECSFSKGIMAETIEGKVLQDSDRLESVGAISIMRTYSSGGQMGRPLYHIEDPLRKNSLSDVSMPLKSSTDLFFVRLLLIKNIMITETGKKMVIRRSKFLHTFLKELEKELKESGVL